ncbi:MAG: DUF2804 domain-containing protein [Pirellulales bacterium]|nr:DUF2804 domain-containing protein [Pirellulales bacterium]
MRPWIVLFAVLSCVGITYSEEKSEQIEFTESVPLLSDQGELSAWGWARHAHMAYNREAIPANRLDRVKEWEHYTIMSPQFTVGVTIAQIGTLLIGSAELIDYANNTQHSATTLGGHPKDRSIFTATPYGATEFRRKENFVSMKFEGNRRLIAFNFLKTAMTPAMAGEFELVNEEADESIALARPFAEPGQFFYENKIFGMLSKGKAQVGDTSYELPAGESFAIFDWGRGIWPRESQWFWGQAAGKVGARLVAINLGHGYGDDRRGTANAILVDRKLYKLGDVACEFDPADRMKPWKFTSDDGRLSLVFQPIYHQQSKQQIAIAAAELHKIHGKYSGTLVVDGEPIEVKDMLGFAEHMSQKW